MPEVEIQVSEHRVEIKLCSCCDKETRAAFPGEVSKAVKYDTEIKLQMAYLNTEQHLPLERTCDLLEEFYANRPSEGTIVAVCAEAAHKVQKSNEAVKEHLVAQEAVGHFDETGMVINGVLHWLNTASTSFLTYYVLHPKRGTQRNHHLASFQRACGA